jgi:quercetin dioxygenase-like cupin family protein
VKYVSNDDLADIVNQGKFEMSPFALSQLVSPSDRTSGVARSRHHLEADAGRAGDVKITRRGMLAATGGLAALAAARPGAAEAPSTTGSTKRRNETMEIMRSGSRPSGKGPAEYFTGSVRIDPLFQSPDPARARGNSVTFEPGARTAWHTHPLGQTLIVTAGCGWVQRDGGPVEEIRPGDVVWFSPGEKHWHGATATTGMTHIAIQEALDGKNADWMEKVSDEQYRR